MASTVRILLAALAALVLAAPASADTGDLAPTEAPQGLHGYLYRANDSSGATQTFARTPAFAWEHVAGANQYELQLSTSRTFAESSVVWQGRSRAAVITVPMTLPWTTGAKYSWYARVRAIAAGQEGPWGAPYGFNIKPPQAPRSLSTGTNSTPGMIRWTPVEGATAYEVVFLFVQSDGLSKRIWTSTTAADLREYYTLHPDAANVVYWRVRAVREVLGEPLNKIPVVSYGPWSARVRTVEPQFQRGPLQLLGSISRAGGSDVVSTSQSGAPGKGPHGLLPGFWWTGTTGPAGEEYGICPQSIVNLANGNDSVCPLYHVYVYTDNDCVNRVHVSDLVGSPAYVPRRSPPLDLPNETKKFAALTNPAVIWFLDDGDEGDTFDAGDERVRATGVAAGDATAEATAETATTGEGGTTEGTTPTEPSSEPAPSEEPASPDDETFDTHEASVVLRKNGLWDADWPTSRYYWTVVPVVPVIVYDDPANPTEGKIEYKDVLFGQDMCTNGQVMAFGKSTEIVTAAESGVPYVSGLSPDGKVISASSKKPRFFGRIVVAWKPVAGAVKYEVQWSRSEKRWRAAGRATTPSTQAMLNPGPGRWFYRVRGHDTTLPGPTGLSWSEPVEVEIVAPKFTVIGRS